MACLMAMMGHELQILLCSAFLLSSYLASSQVCCLWRETGGRKTGRKHGGRCMRGGRRGVGSGIPKVAGSGIKRGEIMQHCAIFCNQKNAKRREPTNTGWELGLKDTGSRRFKPPCPPPPHHICFRTTKITFILKLSNRWRDS